jgi:glycerophosphoryl diester phosphodiesterase
MTAMHHILWTIVVLALAAAECRAVTPLQNAHAHNDYLHTRPLLDALDQGFTSVEADVFLVDGKLLVAHERATLKPDRTLEALYLEPLAARVKENNGHVHKNGKRFYLLIDFKSDGQPTYDALRALLAKYQSMLTTVENGKAKPGAVTIIISGNRPNLDAADTRIRYAGLDGRPSDLTSKLPAHFMPMISDNWRTHFKWSGTGEMPTNERTHLREIVQQAHAAGRVVRFWATPENESVWRELREANVDLINTDDLPRLSKFLRTEQK